MMICCEKCQAWQHNDCMGVTEIESELPEKYFCEQCRPSQHKELLAAMKRGEKPWEEVARKKLEEKNNKKKPKKGGRVGRPSAAHEGTPAKSENTPTPAPSAPAEVTPAPQEKGKRKLPSAEVADSDEKVTMKPCLSESAAWTNQCAKPSKLRKPSGQERHPSESSQTSRKQTSTTAPQKRSARTSAAPATNSTPTSIAELSNPSRKGAATFMKNKFEAQIKQLSQTSRFRIPDDHNLGSLAEHLALAVENAMFQNHCDPAKPDFGGPYKLQMTEIVSNTTRNEELMLRLLNGVITPEKLAVMPSDEMASEELQREMASMKEEADKQATLIQETGRPMMRRTHKGDEYIEDPSNHAGTTFSISAPVPRRRESDFPGPQSPTIGQDTHLDEDPLTVDTTAQSPTSHDRKPSTNFDIKNVWQSVQSPDNDQSPQRFGPPHPQPEEREVVPKREHDAEIDRLLEEDDNESAPYSPGEYSRETIAWRGVVDMPNVGKFKAFAHHVAGADVSARLPVGAMFPESLTLSGRIHSTKADDYLSSLGAARSTDVVVHSIMPAEGSENTEARAQFEKLFRYFVDRDRWGVVSDAMHRDYVTDTYIVPLEAGFGTGPVFLTRLDFNIIESPRPRPMLLAVFVLKWRMQPQSHAAGSLGANSSSVRGSMLPPHGSSGTPVGPGPSTMSPLTGALGPSPITQRAMNQLPLHNNGDEYGSRLSTARDETVARKILGHLIDCATAQELLRQGGIPDNLLPKLKKVFEEHPIARTDFEEFARILDKTVN